MAMLVKEWTVAEPINLEEQTPPWSKYKREMNSACGDISLCDMCGGWDGRHEV